MGKCVNLSCGKAINTKKILTKQAFIYIINKATKKIILRGVNIMSKRTFQPNNRRRSKKMGFFARMQTNIIKRRRKKGRKVLAR